jgi:CheY-like chemotaxis protein
LYAPQVLLVILLICFLFAFAMYRKRYIFLSAIVSLIGSSTIVIAISVFGNGIYDAAMLFIPAIIIFSCLIFNDVLLIAFGFFIFLLFNSSVIFHWNSLLPKIPQHDYTASEVILINLIFIGLGFIGRLFKNSFFVSDNNEPLFVSEGRHIKKNPGKTIAIVEDNEDIIFLLSDAFKHHGHTTIPFDSANALQTWVEQHGTNIDLVITDFYLKVSDGRMVIEYIRRMIPHIPIILISGYPLHELGLSIDFYSDIVFLQKPFTARVVLEKAELMFQQREMI